MTDPFYFGYPGMSTEPTKANTPEVKPMTVRELIAALQALSPEQRELEVCTEGCDCWGEIRYFVEQDLGKSGRVMLLARPDAMYARELEKGAP